MQGLAPLTNNMKDNSHSPPKTIHSVQCQNQAFLVTTPPADLKQRWQRSHHLSLLNRYVGIYFQQISTVSSILMGYFNLLAPLQLVRFVGMMTISYSLESTSWLSVRNHAQLGYSTSRYNMVGCSLWSAALSYAFLSWGRVGHTHFTRPHPGGGAIAPSLPMAMFIFNVLLPIYFTPAELIPALSLMTVQCSNMHV